MSLSFQGSSAPSPLFAQINIAPEIARIPGIFEGYWWKGGNGTEQGALCDTSEVHEGRAKTQKKKTGVHRGGHDLGWWVQWAGTGDPVSFDPVRSKGLECVRRLP